MCSMEAVAYGGKGGTPGTTHITITTMNHPSVESDAMNASPAPRVSLKIGRSFANSLWQWSKSPRIVSTVPSASSDAINSSSALTQGLCWVARSTSFACTLSMDLVRWISLQDHSTISASENLRTPVIYEFICCLNGAHSSPSRTFWGSEELLSSERTRRSLTLSLNPYPRMLSRALAWTTSTVKVRRRESFMMNSRWMLWPVDSCSCGVSSELLSFLWDHRPVTKTRLFVSKE